jgi:hypothetical protein
MTRRGLDHQPAQRSAGQIAADLAIDRVGRIRCDRVAEARGIEGGSFDYAKR